MIEQRRGHSDDAPWVVEGGRRVQGHDHNRRLSELQAGLVRHAGVRGVVADATDARVEQILGAVHEPRYLAALRGVRSTEPVLMPELAAPGLALDIPVCTGLVAAAREGVRTAITAAQGILAGARFAYALCRPPGHHAGPGWLGGYCYLNTTAAAVLTLREGGMRPVGILDLDLHYPNGTSAIVASMPDVSLHSLHAWPVTNSPSQPVLPRSDRERLVEFRGAPEAGSYLDAVAASLRTLARSSAVLVLALGYDTIEGDPHGSWGFAPAIFAQIGRLLAAARLPVCVVQEGGYALSELAACSHAFASGLLDGQPRVRVRERRTTRDRTTARDYPVSRDRVVPRDRPTLRDRPVARADPLATRPLDRNPA
jgi:acetoin utilization deacetylase AcuC-like enzyme